MERTLEQHVRFYFMIAISCLIPPNARSRGDAITDDEWEQSFLHRLEKELKSTLSKYGLEVAYLTHEPVDAVYRLFSTQFMVSCLRNFCLDEVSRRSGNVKEAPLKKAKTEISQRIKNALEADYIVIDITYKYAVSRTFQFMLYLEGDIVIEHEITPSNVKDAGGVSDAIELFCAELFDCGEACGYEIYPEGLSAPSRRPRNNIYRFTITRTAYLAVPENEVLCENFAAIHKDMPENSGLLEMLDFTEETLSSFIQSERDMLNWWIGEEIGQQYSVIKHSLDFIDYDEDGTDFHEDYTDGL